MLIVMRKAATEEQIDRVLEVARARGLTPVSIPGAQRTAVGLMVEVHHEPDKALSDGPKSLLPEAFAKLARAAQAIHQTQRAQTI